MVSADELTSPVAPGLASLVLTHPGSTATEMTSGNLRFQARARATSHALLSAYARRGSVSQPRARELRACGPRQARAQPEQPSVQLGGQQVGQ